MNIGSSVLKEQISLNDYIRRDLLHKKFHFQDKIDFSNSVLGKSEKGIVPKIDWFSLMVSDVSICDIFTWLQIPDELDIEDDILKLFYQVSVGYDERLFFGWNGINISFSLFDIRGQDLDVSFFTTPVSRVKIDITATGLDYIRAAGIDIDDFLRCYSSYDFFKDGWNITRVDFSFDFINWQADLLNRCFDYVRHNHTESNRLVCCGMASSLCYTERHGSDETLYVGSPRSDKLLRIYDKRLQFIDRDTGAYIKDNPYSNPDSWIRIEWQLRNKKAFDVLFSIGDFFSILKEIHQTYSFADLSTPAHRRQKALFWDEIFQADDDYNTISKLVLNPNIHFVQLTVPRDTTVLKSIPNWFGRLLELKFALKTRGSSVDDFINDYWIYMQNPIEDPGLNAKRLKRLRGYSNALSQHSNYNDLKGNVLVVTDGVVRFR